MQNERIECEVAAGEEYDERDENEKERNSKKERKNYPETSFINETFDVERRKKISTYFTKMCCSELNSAMVKSKCVQ